MAVIEQPPHDHDAERALLGSILVDETVLERLNGQLVSSSFYYVPHQWIFSACKTLYTRREAIDSLTVKAELERRGRLKEAGGSAYLSELLVNTPTAINAEAYAAIVARKSEQRTWINFHTQIGQLIYKPDFGTIDKAELLDQLRLAGDSIGAERKDTWQAYTLADAYAPREPLRFIVAGLCTLPSLSIVYGSPGTLKSFLLADLAVCVAGGVPWLAATPGQPDASRAVIQAPVVWVDCDNGSRRSHERFEALARARDIPPQAPLFYYSMPTPWPDAGSLTDMDQLAARITARGAQLVIIDNLGLITGSADENSAEMARVMGNLRALSEHTGAAVILIHHQRKSNGFNVRSGESLRGHSSIEAAIDLALVIEREDRSSVLTMRSTKARDCEVHPFGANFTYAHKPDGNELDTARFWGTLVEDTTSDRAVCDQILEVVTAHEPINQSSLKVKVREALPQIGLNRIITLANRLVSDGRLRSTSGARGSILYQPV